MNLQKLILILFILCFLPLPSLATELGSEYNPSLYKGRSKQIIPDESAYGVLFGSSEKEVIAAFGLPSGVLAINDSKKALLYGSSHLFIFKKGRFRELRVSDHVIDWELTRQMDVNPFFDGDKWNLHPGLTIEMDFGQTCKAINRLNAKPDHRMEIEGETFMTTVFFSSW